MLHPERLFAPASWLILLVSVGALALSGYEVIRRHLIPASTQEFNFGSLVEVASNERVGLDPIIQAHIFGVVPPKPKAVEDKPKIVEAPKTKLNLVLTGVITSPEPDGGIAMIEIQRGQTSVVRVGAKIGKTGAKLNAVYSDHILIERQGKLEKLPIERDTLDLVALASSNDQTISALNINVAEFEALATVDPSETDITRLLPQPQEPQIADDATDGVDATAVRAGDPAEADERLQDQQQMEIQIEELRRQQEAEMERQQREMEKMQELQLQGKAARQLRQDAAGSKVRQELSGGLKPI
jgi:type II secretion system protein C